MAEIDRQIWYHGTHPVAAASILVTGFRAGTYFAKCFQDALAFGGLHVFGVELDKSKINRKEGDNEKDWWQLHTLEPIGRERIVSHTVFSIEWRQGMIPGLKLRD